MSTGPASRLPNSAQQKELDLIWEQVQARVIELAGGDPKKIRHLGIGNVIEQIDSYNDKKKPESSSRLKSAVDKTLQCIQTIGGIVTQGVSTVFGPADMCYNALSFVIQAWKGYEGMFENLSELLEKCIEFMDRLGYYTEKMDANLTKLACQNLRLFVEICHRIIRLRKKHTRFLAFTKQLFLNDDGVQDLLALMERLNGKEALLVAAQTFEIVSDSAGDLKIIVEGQNEQRKKQDSQQRRKTIAEALAFRSDETNSSTGEPIATWRRTLDSHMTNIVADTGDWLTEDAAFQDWAQAEVPSKPILVLQGRNYSGKTSAMVNALRYLRQQSENMLTSRIVTAYFFPGENAKQLDESSAEPILEMASKALLWQMGVSFEALTKAFANRAQTSKGFMGWLDVWEQLYISNPERLNPDTTFFILIDSSDASDERIEALVPLLQQLASTTLGGKTRILLTAGPQAATECVRQVSSVQFEIINIVDRNSSDIEKYINHRMDKMPMLRDPSRPGIAEWRKRILAKLAEKCAGDYFKLNSSLSALSQMHLVQDIEEVLAQADSTRADQILAEISHLNNTRTPKEIKEINEIIVWVKSGRRWLSAEVVEALLAIKHQAESADAAPFLTRRLSGSLLAASSGSGGTLAVSLLPFSQKLLEMYSLFTITEANEVKWRDPETESHIPTKATVQGDDSKMLQSILSTSGTQMVRDGEIDIVRHFLHNVCPPQLYERFDFDAFFEMKLRARQKEYICFDEDNGDIRIAIAFLTILTNLRFQGMESLIRLARRDLFYHLKKVDLSAAETTLKSQVGPLLVSLLTEEVGVKTLFMPGPSTPFFDRLETEASELQDVRSEWLYSLDGVREVVRWLSDSAVTKLIHGDNAEAFVKSITGLDQNLHRVILSHAAKHLARQMFYNNIRKRLEIFCVCLFLRGYLMRCDAGISSVMESDAAFYIEQEKDAAKEIESVNNFDLEMVKKIEDWAATAIDKANNTPAQDSHWEYQASFFIRNMCPTILASEATLRAKKAVELDPKNYFARISLYYTFGHAEAVEALTTLKDELENDLGEERSQLLATVSIRLGIQLWNIGEDYEAAARAHVESLTYDFVGWEYMGVLKQYAEKSSHEHTINFFRQLNERRCIWESDVYEFYYYINDIFDDEHAIAEAADSTEGWDVVKTLFNLMLEGMQRPELCKMVSQCHIQLADCLGASSSASVRAERVAHYESGLDAFKGVELTNGWGTKYAFFSMVQQLSAAYLEQALRSEPGSEILESCLTKIAGLLDMADREGNVVQATSPACSLIVFNRRTGQFDDVVSKWTHKIILEVLDLLSDDDDDNDFEAYLYLVQLMIAMRDTENARIALLMTKWEMRKKMISEIEAANQATTSSNKNLARQPILDDEDEEEGEKDAEEGEKDEEEKDEEEKDEDEEKEDDERENTAEQTKEGANEGGEETQQASEETDEASDETGEAKKETDEASEDAEEADEDSSIGTWTLFCDGCTPELRAVDFPVYLCTECVSLMGFQPECYELLKKGKMERQHECSMEHSFIYVPAWKPDQELLHGHVPLLETGVQGDGEVQQIGWMPLEEWKAKLKDLYVKN
ncbi:putative neutral amino acid permease protein [Ilyonectria robusta]